MSVLPLPDEITQKQATACLAMLVQGLKSVAGPSLVVDATALARFDSSALAVLLELRRECLAMGKDFAVKGLSARLENLATLYGIADLMPAA